MKQLAQEAIDIQNACNGIGVAQGFAGSMLELHEVLNTRLIIEAEKACGTRSRWQCARQ
jgi:hypothetical protein